MAREPSPPRSASPDGRDRKRDKEHKHKERKHKDKEHKHKDRKDDDKGDREHRRKDADKDRDKGKEKPRKDRKAEEGDKDREGRDKHRSSRRDKDRDASPTRDEPEAAPAAAPAAAPRAVNDAPLVDYKPAVNESGGEVSMSIDETNRMRIALGLKPLKLDGGSKKSDVPKEVAEGRARKQQEQKEAEARQIAERVATARERRRQQDQLRSVKTLGEVEGEAAEDDLLSWVEKTRRLEEAAKAEARAKALALERQMDEQDEVDSDDDSEGGGRARGGLDVSAAGLKVKGMEELGVGESVIMTLEDKPILDERGRLAEDEEEDVLENVRIREEKSREKARRAAHKKAKPLYGEDGKVRPLLDKYDEEEEAEAMQLDEAGRVDAEKKRRQEEIRRKLAAGGSVVQDSAEVSRQAVAEYYTTEEAAALFKPKRRKKKGKALRKKQPAEGLDLDELEAAAVAAGKSDLGSRAEREARAQQQQQQMQDAQQQKRQRFDRALEEANYASLALRPGTGEGDDGAVVGEDDELYDTIARARKAAAQQAGPSNREAVQEIVRKRREQEEGKEGGGGLQFTSTAEFVRSIQVAEEADDRAAAGGRATVQPGGERKAPAAMEDEGEDMDVDVGAVAAAAAAKGGKPASMWGNWVPAEVVEAAAAAGQVDEEMEEEPGTSQQQEKDELYKQSVTREKVIGRSMAGFLDVLRERGELKEGMESLEWSGRTNDMKKVKLLGLEEVYKGGRSQDTFERDVETALTRLDEHGRVLTPKEAFRQLCYDFHGKKPSKNKIDKRNKKASEDLARKRMATTDSQVKGSMDALRQVQAATSTPYLMLTGQLKPGQISDPASGYATVDRAESIGAPTPLLAPTPVLGGRATPLAGAKKVEAMLGLRKGTATPGAAGGGGRGGMGPPPPKRPRQ